MRKFTACLFLIYFFLSSIACTKVEKEKIEPAYNSDHDTVYIGLTGDLGIYVEDHVTPKSFTDFFGWDTANEQSFQKLVDYVQRGNIQLYRTPQRASIAWQRFSNSHGYGSFAAGV